MRVCVLAGTRFRGPPSVLPSLYVEYPVTSPVYHGKEDLTEDVDVVSGVTVEEGYRGSLSRRSGRMCRSFIGSSVKWSEVGGPIRSRAGRRQRIVSL